jgi:hypothetical protein
VSARRSGTDSWAVRFDQTRPFVSHDMTAHKYRGHDQTPVEVDAASDGMRTPSGHEIGNRSLLRAVFEN